jgi:hypothetical protein
MAYFKYPLEYPLISDRYSSQLRQYFIPNTFQCSEKYRACSFLTHNLSFISFVPSGNPFPELPLEQDGDFQVHIAESEIRKFKHRNPYCNFWAQSFLHNSYPPIPFTYGLRLASAQSPPHAAPHSYRTFALPSEQQPSWLNSNMFNQQFGAAEARRAHNPEVT